MSPCCLQTSATPPAFPGLCVSVSGSRLQLEGSALLMLGMASRTCHHSPCHWWSLWMGCLLRSLQAGCWAGREGKLPASRRETSVGDLGQIQPC